ncbi:MAG: hypothetical protein ACKOE4_04310 [Candidatus Kapaibacterium sp.]
MMILSRTMVAIVALCVFGSGFSPVRAQANKEALALGVFVGPAVPSDAVSRVYSALDTLGAATAYNHASGLGYHIGGRVRFGLTGGVSFTGGASVSRFAGQDQTAVLSGGQTLTLQTATTLIPVSAGLTAFAFTGLVAPFASAEVTYTYRTVTIATGNSLLQDIIINAARVELEPQTSRIGAAAAAGVQLDIGGLKPFFELRYHWTNLTGAEPGEAMLSYLNISLGLLF